MNPTTITILLLLFIPFSSSSDTLNSSSILTINDTLVSASSKFELGFFSNAGRTRWYLGIWYKDLPGRTIIWVANRDEPGSSGSVTGRVGEKGNVVVVEEGRVLWSSNETRWRENVVARLLDDGNLVVRKVFDEMSERNLWESFDYAGNTLVAGQKMGRDFKTGRDRFLKSWIGDDDPGSGVYTFRIDPRGDPEQYLRKGDEIVLRSGPWVGTRWSGVPQMKPSSVLNFSLVVNKNEVSYTFKVLNSTVKSRLVVDSDGVLRRYTWVPDIGKWSVFWYQPDGQCDDFNLCGAFGFCNSSSLFLCQCMQGFEPKNEQAWALRDGSGGCVRKTQVECGADGFLVMENMKLPQGLTAFVNRSMSIVDCREMCQRNCSCTAYAASDFVNGVESGCVVWTGDLIDLRSFPQGGQNLYVSLAASDLVSSGGIASFSDHYRNTRKVILAVMIPFGICSIILVAVCFTRRRKRLFAEQKRNPGEKGDAELELPLFDFGAIVTSTENFSEKNKLGEGGFGTVYKGLLDDGREVAVKRLSKYSGQGTEQFKNELVLIAKLQHRNLVRLLGCCVDKDEKILIYEFLPNKSLDTFIFNPKKKEQLSWVVRFNIIEGTARGLLYLHRDSRLRIIHRDLKASNVLLDNDMNPKISDFGLARTFLETQDSANTRLIVGTFGYMSPEYAMKGTFSEKSDVFSFGILLLEIISGKKNSSFCSDELYLNLPAYAWHLWDNGRGLDLVDEVLIDDDSDFEAEVLRCINVGLLCVQDYAADRPSMSSVVLMLSSEAPVPYPKQPAFFPQVLSSSADHHVGSLNMLSITAIEGR